MKILPFKIPKSTNNTLLVQEDKGVSFYTKLHQHKEIQISYVVAGRGTLIIGDSVNQYKEDDLFIFGSNVPHVLKSDVDSCDSSYMISIFFTQQSFGEHFFDLPELKVTKQLIDDTFYGIQVNSNKEKLKKKFKKIRNENTLERFITFFKILHTIGLSDYKKIASFTNKRLYTDNEGKRMSNIFEYTLSNFHKEITLNTIANIANMTPNAFCRYFKTRTNKTYFQFLIELRIENACKLLKSKNNLSIAEISYQCGFKNISNFNRKFKHLKNASPRDFREHHTNFSID